MTDSLTKNAIDAHLEWLGFVQPTGLVVAPPVLVERGVVLDRHARPRQERFLELLDDARQRLADPQALFTDFLGWQEGDLAAPADSHRISLPELGVMLEPSFAVADPDDGGTQLLIRFEPAGLDLDRPVPDSPDGWTASPQARFERLLRETDVATGILCTPEAIRLVHAPKGETSGHISFRVADMATVMGRPILAALDLLLGEHRLFRAPDKERLKALLAASREAQNLVSIRLARQVLGALYELLRGFGAADAQKEFGFTALCRERPEEVYGGLVTTLMRLVFILYAEDRDLMPQDPVYERSYGLRGLFDKLRDDAARHGDLMDRRYGAWARLLALFRLIHQGGGHGGLRFTARKGRLFDPDRYPFLEGRSTTAEAPDALPMVPDGTVWRMLKRLLVLDGERLSYRTLDVEQIGSVYQIVMGFKVELTRGRSLALRSKAKNGVALVVDLDELLALPGDKRAKHLVDLDVAKLTPKEQAALKAARSVSDLEAALAGKVDREATPEVVPAGVPVLQPTDERRRSGSHYTPRSLTEPIVAETLRPILERLGPKARPEAILDLKILDPAMGSGAFLVEACRQLAHALVRAWEVHGIRPELPPDEDALLYARRLVAQRCLYGVDKNAMAAELGKLSLWLATLARDHEFTFLDHAIRHGDSLVGLDRRQIEALHWAPDADTRQSSFLAELVRARLQKIEAKRDLIRSADESLGEEELRPMLADVLTQLDDPKLIGDAVIAAFFAEEPKKALAAVRQAVDLGDSRWRDRLRLMAADLRAGEKPVPPFHWPFEFPEVFNRPNPGFDAIVGNPPFAGKNSLIAAHREGYPNWLKTIHAGAHGNADLVAHFYRRAFALLRRGGCFGLIATNTIRQGDTRSTGLRPIREAGGTIYAAKRRYKWPGEAAVVVCVCHVHKGPLPGPYRLDGREVPKITAFLFHDGGDADPARLAANRRMAFEGVKTYGKGFVFENGDSDISAGPVALAEELISKNARNAQVIRPYLDGEAFVTHPEQKSDRLVIDFSGKSKNQALGWPDVFKIVENRVKSEREKIQGQGSSVEKLRKEYWLWERPRSELFSAIRGLKRVICISRVSKRFGVAFTSSHLIFSTRIIVFALDACSDFCILQSRVHEVWAWFFASSIKDDLLYTPSDCFETFPLPEGFATDPQLEDAGERYYRFRADLMVQNNEGLTKTYNRFHDPDERSNSIAKLRRLHEAIDRAVLDAYGWNDIPTACTFELEWQDEDGGSAKKPWRYRWPEEVRDEVLARLLALNKERAEVERLAGLRAGKATRRPRALAS